MVWDGISEIHSTIKCFITTIITVIIAVPAASQYVHVKVKVKASHTGHRALGPELIPGYRQSACR